MEENNNENGVIQNKQQDNKNVEQNNQQSQNNQNNVQVDVEAEKKKAIEEMLKGLGVTDSEELKGIIEKHKKDEEGNLSDLEKKTRENDSLLKELVETKEKLTLAEAKLEAIKQGANKDLIDDLVIVAKSKVTKDKDIIKVIAEMKESNSIYFKTEEIQGQNKKNQAQKKNTTSAVRNLGNGGGEKKDSDNQSTFASRFFKNNEKGNISRSNPFFD